MFKKFRKFMPNPVVNYGKHLPEAIVANIRYGFPSRKLKVIGVTGTDGKTTTVNMIYKILKDAGKRVSMVSTINAVIAGKVYDTGFHVTSPNPTLIQKFLKESIKNNDEFFVLEVTSHALDQFRVWGIKFEVGLITNITHEHLDYHKNFNNYLKAKYKLIKNSKIAIINRDDSSYNRLVKLLKKKKIYTFGLRKKADIRPSTLNLNLKIPGDYNRLNTLAAGAVCLNLGVSKQVIKKSLDSFKNLTGRFEYIKNNKGVNIIIDFAHTPNALENVLKTLRKQTKGNLITVFGAASERDSSKRPLMGEVASSYSDYLILTSEDPRFEDPSKIIEEIASGINGQMLKKVNVFKEPDRKKAIEKALTLAKKGDSLGIFGKGHETSMSIKGKEIAWSDKGAVLNVLR